MKIRMIVEIASNSAEGIKSLEEAVKSIRSGEFQRDMEYDYKKNKVVRCKATVEVLEDKK